MELEKEEGGGRELEEGGREGAGERGRGREGAGERGRGEVWSWRKRKGERGGAGERELILETLFYKDGSLGSAET